MWVKANQLKVGAKLLEDVETSLGNVLFRKGKVLSERDLQVMNAFLVQGATVDQVDKKEPAIHHSFSGLQSKPHIEDEGKQKGSFQEQFYQCWNTVKKLFMNVKSGAPLSVYDLRNAMEQMIPYITPQNLLAVRETESDVEDYLYRHSVHVGMISYSIAREMDEKPKEWIQVMLAGTLHDIGKLKMDDNILHKKGPLTHEEFEAIKKHTVAGYNILKPCVGLNEGVPLAALQHHEREDGSGYPLGFAQEKIHHYAKIVAIADVFNAMSANKVYRGAVSPFLVMEQLISDSFGKLSPTMVYRFVKMLSELSIGKRVRLSNNKVAEIVYFDPNHPTRPWVKVDQDILNLTINRDIHIEEIIADTK